jgi:hypothetical protein
MAFGVGKINKERGLQGIAAELMSASNKMHSMFVTECPMPAVNDRQPSLIERTEQALLLLAYFMELDGDVYLPLYEKFETELKELKAREDVRARAQRLLATYREVGGLKAIR